MKVIVVMYSYFDDWQLLGVADSEEQAKEMKRSAVPLLKPSHPGTHKDTLFKRIDFIECELGEVTV